MGQNRRIFHEKLRLYDKITAILACGWGHIGLKGIYPGGDGLTVSVGPTMHGHGLSKQNRQDIERVAKLQDYLVYVDWPIWWQIQYCTKTSIHRCTWNVRV